MNLSHEQQVILDNIPEHARQAVETLIQQSMDIEIDMGGGLTAAANKSKGITINMNVFTQLLDQILGLGEINQSKRARLEQAWKSGGAVFGMGELCRLSIMLDCKIARAVALLNRLQSDGIGGKRKNQMELARKYGATEAILQKIWGCTEEEFQELKAIKFDYRPWSLSEEEDIELFYQWEELGKPTDLEALIPLLTQTGYPLHVVWPLIEDWTEAEDKLGGGQ